MQNMASGIHNEYADIYMYTYAYLYIHNKNTLINNKG